MGMFFFLEAMRGIVRVGNTTGNGCIVCA